MFPSKEELEFNFTLQKNVPDSQVKKKWNSFSHCQFPSKEEMEFDSHTADRLSRLAGNEEMKINFAL